MAKLVVILLMALVVVHATARDIPNDNTKPNEKTESTVVTTADAPAANGVDDEKNFIVYGGGVGGWAGIGYAGGVIPVLGGGIVPHGLPTLGGLGGLGGAGAAGGAGAGAGGLGGVGVGGTAGGAAGKVVP